MSHSDQNYIIETYDFSRPTDGGLLIIAGGFEDRSLTFMKKLKEKKARFERIVLFQYQSQYEDNLKNFMHLFTLASKVCESRPEIVPIDLQHPLISCDSIKQIIQVMSLSLHKKIAFIDISGLTNLFFTVAIHNLLNALFDTHVIYTESRYYYPYRQDKEKIIKAWKEHNYELASEYLQSRGLGSIIIHPEFQGNFRPGKQTCLINFVGFEPNRIKGLVDEYAPGKLIIYYGVSPHKELTWRTQFSKDLHEDLFSDWYVHEAEISTMEINKILITIGVDFEYIQEEYDVAIAPQNSKMQALAAYLFWRQHPEIQLIFTTPVSFKPNSYSKLSKNTFILNLKKPVR